MTCGLQKLKLQEKPKARLTWTIRTLVKEAKNLLGNQKQPLTPYMYFVAFLALISAPPSVEGMTFWAYVPQASLFQPVGWLDREPIRILTNDTRRLGGSQDSDVRPKISSYVTYEGRADSLPICLTLQGEVPDGCLPVSYRTFLADAPDHEEPDKRWMWEIQIQTLGFANYNETFQKDMNMPISSCIHKYGHKDGFWDSSLTRSPTWLTCCFPNAATKYNPKGTSLEVWDYSASSGDEKYEKYIKSHSNRFHGYEPKDLLGEKIRRWFSPGFVEPIWVAKAPDSNVTVIHNDLFRLVAAANMFLEKRPGTSKVFPYEIRACISYPNALLLGHQIHVKISQVGKSYHVNCYSCKLTNCITSAEPKDLNVMLIVRRPPFVMLPVDLEDEPWYDNSALRVLTSLNDLIRPKRFAAALILGITALISILTTFAVATTALVQEIHTAHYVNALNKNITFALMEQASIDTKLETKINLLEEVVLTLGQDVANLKTLQETRCHSGFQSICVTPLPYNTSLPWDKIKAHLQGVWKDNDITHDLGALQKDISAMSKAHLQIGTLKSLAKELESNMRALNPLDWIQYIILMTVLGLLIILVVILFPCLLKCLFRSFTTIRKEMFEFHIKNKKRGTATSTAVPPV